MNPSVKKLAERCEKKERIILGLMSGTSMDGIDMGLCRVQGHGFDTECELLEFTAVDVDESLTKRFRELAWSKSSGTGDVILFSAELGNEWVRRIKRQIADWGLNSDDIDVLASHGQTILHQPDPNNGLHTTLQIVDGDRLAIGTGILTISDFRQKHILSGYEGAPLAPLGELFLFSDKQENRVLLNLGGIGNFSWLPAGPEKPVIPFATDTGPANTLMDEAVKRLVQGETFDVDGQLARNGSVDENLLEKFLTHPFFKVEAPKSTGQELFNWEWVHATTLDIQDSLNIHDLLATLAELTAVTVSDVIRKTVGDLEATVYVSGGGLKNSYLIDRLRHHLSGFRVEPSTALGIDPDAKEAVLFSVIANETVAGTGWINRDGKRFTLGKISLP